MKIKAETFVGILALLTIGVVGFVVYKKLKGDNTQEEKKGSDTQQNTSPDTTTQITNVPENIIVGDSQTPYITKQSKKVQMLGKVGGENVLWKGGMGLKWLRGAIGKFPTNKSVKNVVINIGTNGGFNQSDSIEGLVTDLRRTFPNAKLHVVQGSWGWGGNKNVTSQKVKAYYDRFATQGVNVIQPAIGVVKDPHGHLPIYKEIGSNLDKAI